jgi:hypothetical protein
MAEAVMAYLRNLIPYVHSCSQAATVENVYHSEITLNNKV